MYIQRGDKAVLQNKANMNMISIKNKIKMHGWVAIEKLHVYYFTF